MTLAALKTLEQAGVVRQISPGIYDRQFAATELFDLVTAYEANVMERGWPRAIGSAADGGVPARDSTAWLGEEW
jgi:hypothetical protein